MKRTVFAVTASVFLAGTFAVAQSQDPGAPETQQPQTPPSATQPSSQDRSESETRITGCLIQGSSPNVFILDNARLSTDAKTAEDKKYVVVMADAAGLRNQLNRQVTITGTTDEKAGAGMTTPSQPGQAGQPGQPGQVEQPGEAGQQARTTSAEERDLPRLSAKAIVRVADVCTTT